MIVPIFLRRASFSGNGVATAFSFAFPFLQDSDLVITEVVNATGVETPQVLYTAYTVTGAGQIGGGTVTRIAGALPTGTTLIVERTINPVQTRHFPNQTAGFAETSEFSFSYAMMLAQEFAELLGTYDPNTARVPKLPKRGVDGSSYYDARSNRIANVDDPTANQDAATKKYVDTAVGGVVSGGGGAFVSAIVTAAALPAPSVTFANLAYLVRDAGLPDILKVCLRQSDGATYEWVAFASASA